MFPEERVSFGMPQAENRFCVGAARATRAAATLRRLVVGFEKLVGLRKKNKKKKHSAPISRKCRRGAAVVAALWFFTLLQF